MYLNIIQSVLINKCVILSVVNYLGEKKLNFIKMISKGPVFFLREGSKNKKQFYYTRYLNMYSHSGEAGRSNVTKTKPCTFTGGDDLFDIFISYVKMTAASHETCKSAG